METKQLFEVRFSDVIDADFEPRFEDVHAQLASASEMTDEEKAFAEFVVATRQVKINRTNSKTVAVYISIEAVRALKSELLWRKSDLQNLRYDDRDNANTYRHATSLINQFVTAIKSCDKALATSE